MRGELPPEVAAALDRAGLRPRSATRITTMTIPWVPRSVHRVELESGGTIKSRQFESEDAATRSYELRARVPEAFVPVLGCHGTVLLEEWVEGEPIREAMVNDARVSEAAELLAALHATPGAGGRFLPYRAGTAEWRESTSARLQRIRSAGALGDADIAVLAGMLDTLDPIETLFGLVHTDFCGENFIVDRTGRLRVVDNERVRIDALGYDVARTSYRWALPATAWDRFRDAYLARSASAEPFEHLAFWGIIAVVHSADVRLRAAPAEVGVPLDRLQEIVAARRAGQDAGQV